MGAANPDLIILTVASKCTWCNPDSWFSAGCIVRDLQAVGPLLVYFESRIAVAHSACIVYRLFLHEFIHRHLSEAANIPVRVRRFCKQSRLTKIQSLLEMTAARKSFLLIMFAWQSCKHFIVYPKAMFSS